MENTSLIDAENSQKIINDFAIAILVDVIKNSTKYRIEKHREFIKKSEALIINNINYLNIVEAETNKIIAR